MSIRRPGVLRRAVFVQSTGIFDGSPTEFLEADRVEWDPGSPRPRAAISAGQNQGVTGQASLAALIAFRIDSKPSLIT